MEKEKVKRLMPHLLSIFAGIIVWFVAIINIPLSLNRVHNDILSYIVTLLGPMTTMAIEFQLSKKINKEVIISSIATFLLIMVIYVIVIIITPSTNII